jgi:hypothetical protein
MKWTLQIDGQAPTTHNTIKSSDDLNVRYTTPNDIPVPLREQFQRMHAKGMPASEIARYFEIPELWVRLFIEWPAGNS